MTKRNKTNYIILCLVTLVYLFIFSFQNNLFTSNLSRIANSTKKGYFSFLVLCILFGLVMYFSFKKMGQNKLAYVGLISLLIGGIIPYDYLQTNSLFSNLHLIGSYISLGLILILELASMFYFENIKPSINRIFKYCLFAIACLAIYQYGTYLFINGFIELIYLSFVIISQMLMVIVL